MCQVASSTITLAPNSNVTFCNPNNIACFYKRAKLSPYWRIIALIRARSPQYVIFGQNSAGMKRLLTVIIVAILLYGAYWFFLAKDTHPSGPKPQAIKISKHSHAFHNSIVASTNAYLVMKNAFVGADTAKIKSESQQFIQAIGNLQLSDLQKDDSTIMIGALQEVSDIKVNAEAILLEKDLKEMRQDFRMVSENLYPFLKTIAYEGPKLYWLN